MARLVNKNLSTALAVAEADLAQVERDIAVVTGALAALHDAHDAVSNALAVSLRHAAEPEQQVTNDFRKEIAS